MLSVRGEGWVRTIPFSKNWLSPIFSKCVCLLVAVCEIETIFIVKLHYFSIVNNINMITNIKESFHAQNLHYRKTSFSVENALSEYFVIIKLFVVNSAVRFIESNISPVLIREKIVNCLLDLSMKGSGRKFEFLRILF